MTTIRQPDDDGCVRRAHAAFAAQLGPTHVLNTPVPDTTPPTTLSELLTLCWAARIYERDAFVWAAGEQTDLAVDQIVLAMYAELRPAELGVLERVAAVSSDMDRHVQQLMAHQCLRHSIRRYGEEIGKQIAATLMTDCHRLMAGYDPTKGALSTYLAPHNRTRSLTYDEQRIVGLRNDRTTSLDALLAGRWTAEPTGDDDPQIIASRKHRREIIDRLRDVHPDVFEHLEHGVPQTEIAERRGLTKQAINNRIARGCRAIRDSLRNHDFHSSTDL